jgi:hypothetical protein
MPMTLSIAQPGAIAQRGRGQIVWLGLADVMIMETGERR